MSSGYTPYTGTGQKQDPNAAKVPGYGLNPPATAQQFNDPVQASGWTGVSTNADPYGIHNIGFDMGDTKNAISGYDKNGKGVNNFEAESLLHSSGFGHGLGSGTVDKPPPMWTGFSKYENQHAPDGSALGSDAAQIQAQSQPKGYPAYGNQYGLGGQISPPSSTGASTSPTPPQNGGASQGVTANVPDTSSRGFNPWSIQGESNARG